MDYNFTKIFFSPGGSCAKVADIICQQFTNEANTINLLKDKIEEEQTFSEKDILIFALPVYADRIPATAAKMLKNLKGNNSYAIPTVVFGNRAYGDALLELTNILKENGFIITSAAAIVAKHSIFPKVATNRPDKSDTAKITEFAKKSLELIKKQSKGEIKVSGTEPYKPFPEKGLPLKLTVNSNCDQCKACAKICPENAIPMDNPQTTDLTKCNHCTACIYVCPQKARNYTGLGYAIISRIFGFMCRARLESEFFYIK